MRDPVQYLLDEQGYDDGTIDDELDYDDTRGWGALDQQVQSALSCFMDDEDELTDESLAPWDPVGWDDD